ncbi:MAG: hypothetical protein AB8H03_09570 [Saprospiraceae bacterium]
MKNQSIYRVAFLFLFLFLLSYFSFAQLDDFSLLPKNGTFYTVSGTKVKFYSFEEKENTYIFFPKSDKKKIVVAKSEIDKIILSDKNEGFAYTSTGAEINFISIEEKENSILFTTTNKTIIEIPKSNLNQIDLKKGNYAKSAALITFGITAVSVTTFILISDPPGNSTFTYSPLIAGVLIITPSLATGLIAGIIGYTVKRSKTIYRRNDSFGYYNSKFKLKTTSPNAIPSLTLSYSF